MSEKKEKLTFYCQLCDAGIESNICPEHGIDFVTIKKISGDVANSRRRRSKAGAQESAEAEAKRINGMLQLGQRASSNAGSGETRLARARPNRSSGPGNTLLPAVPGSDDDNADLQDEQDLYEDAYDEREDAEEEDLQSAIEENLFYEEAEEPEFQEAEEAEEVEDETHAYYSQTSPSQPPMPVAAPRSRLPMLLVAILIIVAAAAGFSYFSFMAEPGVSPTSLYSEADNFYNNENYANALVLFNQFLAKYPNDPLAPVVRDRVSQIQRFNLAEGTTSPESQGRFKELMVKANIAMSKENYVRPENDNVIMYTARILEEDAEYQPAVELRERVLMHFEQMAEAAISENRLNEAINHYRTILEITPNDTEVLQKIHGILTQKTQASQ